MGHESRVTELCVPADRISYPDIKAEDLAVIAMPVYAGRVPALAVARLRNIVSHGAKCAIVAVYGNRAYDDALVEMQDVVLAPTYAPREPSHWITFRAMTTPSASAA